MLKVYKNDIYRIIKDVVKLDPNLFYIVDELDDKKPTSTISIIDSPMKFIFRNNPTSWDLFDCRQTIFSPDFRISAWTPAVASSFLKYDEVSKIFTSWLNNHAKKYIEERESIDIWNQFQFETNIFELAQTSIANNSQFNISESTKILNSIESFKQLLEEKFTLSEAQLGYLSERLNYLTEATDRLGKFDWTNLFVSIMISIAINMGIDTNSGKEFFDMIKIAFGEIKNYIS